jgi:type VI secretion system protein ImpG
MNEEYFPYYSEELAYLRTAGEEFAREHPGVAWALDLGAETSRDPHVERLLQGVALLNARIQHRLDDDFPELSEALLNVLCPQYLAPFPSCAIVQLELDDSRLGADSNGDSLVVQRGARLEIRSEPGSVPFGFRTAYDTEVLPLEVADARFVQQPFEAPARSRAADAAAALRLQLSLQGRRESFAGLHLSRLRLYLHGSREIACGLYERLLKHTLQVVLYDDQLPGREVLLPPSAVRPVGFAADETLLPPDARVQPGYQLLREFFAFPQKFQFVDLELPPRALDGFGRRAELLFLLSADSPKLAQSVQKDTVRLGCTPVVNLFSKRAHFDLHYRQTEYAVIPDEQGRDVHEVYSIDRVAASHDSNRRKEYRSYYDVFHPDSAATAGYWHASRRRAAPDAEGGSPPTDVYLSLTSLNLEPDDDDGWKVHVETTCCNRDAPHRLKLDVAGSGPVLDLNGYNEVSEVRLVTRPTATWRWSQRRGWRWRLLSHLALNHLSLLDTRHGADAFREILSLYSHPDDPAERNWVNGLQNVAYRSAVGRLGHGPAAVARGIEVTLTFDPTAYPAGELFLFASVLREFLGMYVTINSFVETVVCTTQAPEREWHRWPPLAGNRPLV